ncbi:hypothetical protein FRZ67_18935 [Panacibacter ginsenosidivorans]|uniref:Uncharacterized protein n=1 Tax=Panacibacter ginsenosidivorans TaxID=1813871 RepID=A0A5B8VCV2_9BACT|nr:hypothetical protein [Panacibacter ginsenosidivorans]QEC69284.1 hypothetical protein FRZ67_18935 [Panacibacter ginsenosidivorans]
MLQQISWSEYWKIIVILTVLYECSILLLFYRKEIVLLAKRKRWVLPVVRNAASHHTDLSTSTEQEDNSEDEDENLIPFAHDLAEAVKAFIMQAADKGYVKEELCFGLQQRIKDYPQLNNTRYQREINTVIMVECKNKCAIHLRAGELDKLWLS